MHADLATRRRVLALFYNRYIDAERSFELAIHEVRAWFPGEWQPGITIIGNPNSYIRRLYDRRERAVDQLMVASLKLEVSRQRLASRKPHTPRVSKSAEPDANQAK